MGVPSCKGPCEPIGRAPDGLTRSGALTCRVLAFASEFLSRQKAGLISSRAIAASLNKDEIANPLGRPWSDKSVYRMLKHGKEMGFPFIVRSRAEAAQQRTPNYEPRTYVREQNDEAWRRFVSKLRSEENDTLIISRSSRRRSEKPRR